MGSNPIAVTWTSHIALVLSKEFLDIQETVECRFTLKRICDMTRTYWHQHLIMLFIHCSLKKHQHLLKNNYIYITLSKKTSFLNYFFINFLYQNLLFEKHQKKFLDHPWYIWSPNFLFFMYLHYFQKLQTVFFLCEAFLMFTFIRFLILYATTLIIL